MHLLPRSRGVNDVDEHMEASDPCLHSRNLVARRGPILDELLARLLGVVFDENKVLTYYPRVVDWFVKGESG